MLCLTKQRSENKGVSRMKSTQEECGVWLDTTDLRGKRKQPGQHRTITKLLKPLGRYNVPVALNFTQTKLQMPSTRQSSIYSFLVPKRKPTEDRGSCEAICPADQENQWKWDDAEVDQEPEYNAQKLKDCTWEHPEVEQVSEEDEADDDGRVGGSCVPAECRITGSDPRADYSEVLLADLFTQDSQGYRVLAHRGSSQRFFCKSPDRGVKASRKGKENTYSPTLSPKPLCKQRERENPGVDETQSLASLFTQDSQGHRVIAHHRLQTRRPLKEQTNREWERAHTALEENKDSEAEMLFTQDSQGNVVIKHC